MGLWLSLEPLRGICALGRANWLWGEVVLFRSSMSARGQVVIPAELRRRLHLAPGCRFRLYESGTKVILVPELEDPIGAGLGFLSPVHRERAQSTLPLNQPQEQGNDRV
jgi:AbrB family looped-hinge helix DNA binding protein